MGNLTVSIALDAIPKRIRRKLAAGRDLNLAEVARSQGVSRTAVSLVLSGRSSSERIKAALESRIAEILVPGNKYGWPEGK